MHPLHGLLQGASKRSSLQLGNEGIADPLSSKLGPIDWTGHPKTHGILPRMVAGERAESMPYKSHEHYMARALELARQGCSEGGCPIGGVLVDNASGEILGEGHNGLVQEGNPILHGEMAALRAAGRRMNRHNTTMYTTLQPCFMCAGAMAQFGIPRVVIGDVANAATDETIRFLRGRRVEVVVLDPEVSLAARGCVELVTQFRKEKPELWLEDWGGNRA